MADYPLLLGKSAYLSIVVNSVQYDIPCYPGSGITTSYNDRVVALSQGSALGLVPRNRIGGLNTRVLSVVTSPMESWCTAALLEALLTARTAQDNLQYEAAIKFHDGQDTIRDAGKCSGIRLSIDRGSNYVGMEMTFLLRNATVEDSFAAYTADLDEGFLLAENVSHTIDDYGDGVGAPVTVYGSEQETIAIGTGAFGHKYSGDGATDARALSSIDAGVPGYSITFTQAAGAGKRLDSVRTGKIVSTFTQSDRTTKQFDITAPVLRNSIVNAMNPAGALTRPVAFSLYGGQSSSDTLAIS